MTDRVRIRLTVNGAERELEVSPQETLLSALRDTLALTGTKSCCLVGECGACTVSMDGRIVDSCLVLAIEAAGAVVTTVEGLSTDGCLSALQQSFLDHGAVQCGYCIPGQLMAAHDLLSRSASPSVPEVQEALSGNLCRCGCYIQIVEAVLDSAQGGGR